MRAAPALKAAAAAAAGGKLARAAALFVRAGALEPAPAAAFPAAAAVLLRLGRDAEAARELERLARVPGQRWWDHGEWDKPALDDESALSDAERLVRARPGDAWPLLLRSLSKRALLDYAGARADLEEACAAEPGSAALRAMRGRARLLVGDASGLDDLRSAREDLNCGWTRAWLGEALRQRGLLPEALAELDAALALDPGYPRARAWRGGVLRRLGRAEEARAELDAAVALDPLYAWARHERFLLSRDFEDLEAAAREDPRYGFVEFPATPEKTAAALRELDAAAASSPGDPRPLSWRGRTKLDSGDLAGAVADLEAALRLAPRAAAARGWLGEALRRLGRRREAAAQLRRAARGAPGDAAIRARLGRALFELGGADGEARSQLDASVRLDPRCAWARQWRGELLLALGDMTAAGRDFARALALHPGYEDAARALAAVRISTAAPVPERPDEEEGEIHDLLLGYDCNAVCPFCSQELDWRRNPGLETRKAIDEIYAARKRGAARLGLLGGEITLRPDLEALCRFAKRAGFSSIRVLTNGIKFGDRAYCERLVAAGLDTVYFSLHGHEAALHDELVAVPGAFEKAVAGLKHLRALGAKVGVKILVNRRNAPRLAEIADFMIRELGVRDVGLTFPLLTGDFMRHREAMELSWPQAAARVREALRVVDSLGPGAAQPPALHNFPPCVLPERLELNCDLRPESPTLGGIAATGAQASSKRKAPACSSCAVEDRCPGADPAYLEARGDAALRPLDDAVSLGVRILFGCGRHEDAVALAARCFGARPGRVRLVRGLDPAQDLQLEARSPFAPGRRQWRALGRALDRAKARWPRSAVILTARAAALATAGRGEEALRDLDLAVRLDAGLAAAPFWRYLARYTALDSRRRVDAWVDLMPDLDRAAALDPRDPVIWSRRSEMIHNLERATEALEDADRALALDAQAVWARSERADILQEVGRQKEALAEFKRLRDLNPGEGWAWALYARALGKAARWAAARRVFDRAVKLAPRESNIHGWRGELERHAGALKSALRHLDRALRLCPANSYARMWRAKVFLMQERWDRAAADLTRAIRDDGRHLNLFALLSQARFQQGRFAEAAQLLDRVHPLNPRGSWMGGLGAGREAALLAQLDRAVARRPGSAWPLAFRGRVLVESSDPARRERGRRDLDAAVALDTRLGWAWAWRGEAARQGGRLEEALSCLDRAVSMEPGRGLWRGWRGRVLLELSRPKEAVLELSRAAALRPQDGWILECRGLARRQLGLPDSEADLERGEALRMKLC